MVYLGNTLRVVRLLGVARNFITALDDRILDREFGVIETCSYRSTCSVKFSDERHGRAIGHRIVNWLQGLMLAHVLFDVVRVPAIILDKFRPIVVICVGATNVPRLFRDQRQVDVAKDIHHIVDAARASENLSARHVVNFVVIGDLWLSLDHPVIFWISQHLHEHGLLLRSV